MANHSDEFCCPHLEETKAGAENQRRA